MRHRRKIMGEKMTIQDKAPNFREDGNLYLLRCFSCDPKIGRENWAMAVDSAYCAWCGWKEETI